MVTSSYATLYRLPISFGLEQGVGRMTADQAGVSSTTTVDPAGEALASMTAERDHLVFLLAERDRKYVPMLAERAQVMAEAECLAALLSERNRELTALLGDCSRATAEADHLRADLTTCQEEVARAREEITWLRELTDRLTQLDRGSHRSK